MLIYPIYGNWVWGGGWLSQLGSNFGLGHGAVDFAGSGVVHMVGGVASIAGVMVLGPRLGKYKKDGTPNAIPGHHIPMGIAGALILAFGWFGFNPGSTLAGTDLRIGVIAVNTMLASGRRGRCGHDRHVAEVRQARSHHVRQRSAWRVSWPSPRPAPSCIPLVR